MTFSSFLLIDFTDGFEDVLAVLINGVKTEVFIVVLIICYVIQL